MSEERGQLIFDVEPGTTAEELEARLFDESVARGLPVEAAARMAHDLAVRYEAMRAEAETHKEHMQRQVRWVLLNHVLWLLSAFAVGALVARLLP